MKGALKPVPAEPGPDDCLMLSAYRRELLEPRPTTRKSPTEQTHSDTEPDAKTVGLIAYTIPEQTN